MPKLITSSWQPIIEAFIFNVQNCPEFFDYYNLTGKEAMDIAIRRSKGFLIESISRLTSQCTPDVDFHDYNLLLEQFNFEITTDEVALFASLMFEKLLEKDVAKLRVHTNILSSQDIKALFSGYGERNSFMSMFSKIQEDNKTLIDSYISKDRITGIRKSVSYEM